MPLTRVGTLRRAIVAAAAAAVVDDDAGCSGRSQQGQHDWAGRRCCCPACDAPCTAASELSTASVR